MSKLSSGNRQAFALRRQAQRALWPLGLLLQRCQTTAVKGMWREESTAAQETAQLERDAKKYDSWGTGQASEDHEQLAQGPSFNLLASCETSWLCDFPWTHFPFPGSHFNCLLFQHSPVLAKEMGCSRFWTIPSALWYWRRECFYCGDKGAFHTLDSYMYL